MIESQHTHLEQFQSVYLRKCVQSLEFAYQRSPQAAEPYI